MNSINSIHKDQKIIGTKLDDSKSSRGPRRNEALNDMLPCQGASDVSGCSRDHSTPGQSLGVVRKNDAPTSYFESTICIHFAR